MDKKPKQPKTTKKEDENLNIDNIIFEKTEDDNENNKDNEINEDQENTQKPLKEKKERKKREPKEKKKTKAELLKEEKLKEKERMNTLSNLMPQDETSQDNTNTTNTNNTTITTNTNTNNTPIINTIEYTKQPDKIYEDYTTHITTIYHFSDIHIQLYKRHYEYQEVFINIITYLKEQKKLFNIAEINNKNIPIIALITGDILHSKSDLSPECIQLTYNFLKAISSLMPLVIIPGNHDVNMNNKERLDALTPIIADLPKSNPIYYFLESGVYKLSNLMFYHASIFDNKIIPLIYDKNQNQNQNITSIMLYHGRVNGAVLFNGLELSDDTNKTITPSAFDDYDITCLGDIHKHQFLKSNIAYAGSLIQQNLGEDINNHGLIKWNVNTRTGDFVSIQNSWSYVTLYVNDKKANHQCLTKDNTHDTNCPLTKNIRVRILYKNTPESFILDYITLLKMNHNVVEFSYQNDEFLEDTDYNNNSINSIIDNDNSNGNNDNNNGNDNNDNGDTNNTNINSQITGQSSKTKKHKSTLTIDITSAELQNKYIKEYIYETNKNNDIMLTDDEINEIMTINIEQNAKLQEINTSYTNNKFSGHYKLKRLEFSNLFAFGTNNVIDFTKFKGIVGIIAQNHLGKSALLDIIIYTLFDKFTRKGTAKDILNIRSDLFNIKLDISIGKWTYTIIKRGVRGSGKTNTVTTKLEFYRTHDSDGTIENLEEDNTTKTKELIRDYFGCYEDIIHTSFSVQHDNSCFVDAENTERRKELQRIMKFDILDKLDSMAGSQLSKYKDIRDHISKKINNDFIVSSKKSKVKATNLVAIHSENKDYAKQKIKQLHKTILDTSSKLNNDCKRFLENYNKEDTEIDFEDLNDKLKSNKKERMKLKDSIYKHTNNNNENSNENDNENDYKHNNTILNLEDLEDLITHLKEEEEKNSIVIKDANKKIRLLEKANEELYKSRKPSHITIPDEIDNSKTYLSELKDKYKDRITKNKDKIETLTKQILLLKEKEKEITVNNETILALEKTLIKLPEEFNKLIEPQTLLENETKYKKYLCKWVSSLTSNSTNSTNPTITPDTIITPDYTTLCDTPEYKQYKKRATDYFVSKEIETYKTNSNDQEIKNQQKELTILNSQLKIELKQIITLDTQIKELEQKQNQYQTKLEHIENDILNVEDNHNINNELEANKIKRSKYETRINTNEEKNETLHKTQKLINTYENLEKEVKFIEIEMKQKEELLLKFEHYKDQIENNNSIQKEIDLVKAELDEFEEVLEEVEKQYTIENTNITKYTALLEQIKKDLAEYKAIEKNLKLYEVYKKSMKQLPYILLNKIQPLLEKKVNDLLTIITDFTIKFDISDNKIDIYLDRPIYNMSKSNSNTNTSLNYLNNKNSSKANRYILINNGSGFERFISSLAIRIALLDMSNLPKINFLAIDEGFSAFDTHNINNVGQILDYLKTKFDFILTISHLTQIKENSDIIIGLQKDENGYTKIIQ